MEERLLGQKLNIRKKRVEINVFRNQKDFLLQERGHPTWRRWRTSRRRRSRWWRWRRRRRQELEVGRLFGEGQGGWEEERGD